jgi:hypothetical protein
MRTTTLGLARRILAALALTIWGAGCASEPPVDYKTPDEAVTALIQAARNHDQKELQHILGADSERLVSSGDEVEDRNRLDEFIRMYDAKHALQDDGPDGRILVVGNNEWPLPIPVVLDAEKKVWSFDTEAGLDEIISRRVGRNELYTIQVCLAVVDAQREYAQKDPDHDGIEAYAKKFLSDPGKKNGLYWPTAEGEPPSPLGSLVGRATQEGYTAAHTATGEPRPYHGYHYRMLTSQGPNAKGGEMDYMVNGHLLTGFGVVAYPATYGSSGVKTFIVNAEGVVYEKDLGPDTETEAKKMKAFDPGPGWEKSDTSQVSAAAADEP